MNVNSDDDAQTRATSSTRDRVGEEPAVLPAELGREGEARESGVAPRFPARPRIHLGLVDFGRVSARCAPRRAAVPIPAAPRARPGASTRSRGEMRAELLDHARTPRDDHVVEVCAGAAEQLLGHCVDDRAPARVGVTRLLHEDRPRLLRTRRSPTRGSRASRRRIGCRPSPERARTTRRACPRSRQPRRPRRRGARAARGRSGRPRAAPACTRIPRSDRDCRRACPAAARRRGRPGRSERQSAAGGSATPGGRFCCWRGRAFGSEGM